MFNFNVFILTQVLNKKASCNLLLENCVQNRVGKKSCKNIHKIKHSKKSHKKRYNTANNFCRSCLCFWLDVPMLKLIGRKRVLSSLAEKRDIINAIYFLRCLLTLFHCFLVPNYPYFSIWWDRVAPSNRTLMNR